MVKMNIAEAKAKLSELVARAEAGEEVIIARDGVPVALILPANDFAPGAKPQPLGFLAHLGPLENPEAALDDEDESEWGLEFTETDPLRPEE
jgi:prevent-host-death family protein